MDALIKRILEGDGYIQNFRNYTVQPPPDPWQKVNTYAVGGLTEIGYAEDSDLLLVVSSNGRGVFDCISGERLARNPQDDFDTWYDPVKLTAKGIGPLEGQTIRLAGLSGGGLNLGTQDGWGLEIVAPDWPYMQVILTYPYSKNSIYQDPNAGTMVFGDLDIRAYGFSQTGRSFAIAVSSDVTIFSRKL